MNRLVLLLPILLLGACREGGETRAPVAAHEAAAPMGGMAHSPTAMTGDVDRDFATMMIEHHKGAIVMAQDQLKRGKSPELRALSERVIVEQQREIDQMEAFLAKSAR